MSVKEALLYTSGTDSVEFSPNSMYYVNIADVQGLSDVKNTVYSDSSAGQHGDSYLGVRIEPRNIEIVGRVKARDKLEAQNLRRALNRILNPERGGTLTYILGEERRVIDCRVEDAPTFRHKAIFDQFTVSLLCLNPFWREERERRADIAAWMGGFEFPDPGGIELTNSWEVGYREPRKIVDAYNAGDVSGGVRVEFRAQGAVKNPSLINVNTGEFIKLNITLAAGDVLTVTTGYGEKGAVLRRGGVETNAMQAVDVDSTFLQLAAGDNLFRYEAQENEDNLEVTIYHANRYLGV